MATPPPAESGPPFHLALMAAPWPYCNRPSIQLGVLSAALRRHAGLRVTCHHPYLGTAAAVGHTVYNTIAGNMWLGEALLAPALFPERMANCRRLAQGLARRHRLQSFNFTKLQQTVEQQLTDYLDTIPWQQYDLVGLSVCMNQLLPSLFLARELKKRAPQLPIVVGGSSILPHSINRLADLAPVDYAISGEGELPLGQLCDWLAQNDGGTLPFPAGVQQAGETDVPNEQTGPHQDACRPQALNGLPLPDFHDYFRELERFFPQRPFVPILPVEFSRGCWWGKCAFCNLNLQWQGFRQKDPSQMANEIHGLCKRHEALDFAFTDNALPVAGGRRLFTELAADSHGQYRFFAELRAEQQGDFALFRAGGLRRIQVGIEALSGSLLRRLNKGGSLLTNILAMRQAVACGIELEGNLITGFPGSTATEVEETLRALDFVFPFPPLRCARFFLGHDSPVDRAPAEYGITARTVHPNYRQLLPPAFHDLPLLVKGYRGDRQLQAKRWRPVEQKIRQWQRYHRQRRESALHRPLLSYRDGGTFLRLRQECPDGTIRRHCLRGKSRELYLACREIASFDELHRLAQPLRDRQLTIFLTDLVQKRLLFEDKNCYLALAIKE